MNIVTPLFSSEEERLLYKAEMDRVITGAHAIEFITELTSLLDAAEMPESFVVLRRESARYYLNHIITVLAEDISGCGDRIY
ncbi:MAG: hypothetical protein ACOYB1_18345 [Limnohabitans sp.]